MSACCFICSCNLSKTESRASCELPVPLPTWNEFFKGELPWPTGPKRFCLICRDSLLSFQKAHEQMLAMKNNLLKRSSLVEIKGKKSQVKKGENAKRASQVTSASKVPLSVKVSNVESTSDGQATTRTSNRLRATKRALDNVNEEPPTLELQKDPEKRSKTKITFVRPCRDVAPGPAKRGRPPKRGVVEEESADELKPEAPSRPRRTPGKPRRYSPSGDEDQKPHLLPITISVPPGKKKEKRKGRNSYRKMNVPVKVEMAPPDDDLVLLRRLGLLNCKEMQVKGVRCFICKLCCEGFDEQESFLSHFEQVHKDEVGIEPLEGSGEKDLDPPVREEARTLTLEEFPVEKLQMTGADLLLGSEYLVEDDDDPTQFAEVRVRGEVKLVCRICRDEYSTKEDFDFHFSTLHPRHPDFAVSLDDDGWLPDLGLPEFNDEDNLLDGEEDMKDLTNANAVANTGNTLSRNVSIKKSLYPCSQASCSAVFSSVKKLKRHVMSEHITTAYLCPVCSDSFSIHAHFKRHMKIHEDKGEAVFKCDICGVILDTYKDLMKHRGTHKEVLHPCRYCGQEFPTKKDRKDHYQTHVLQRPFQCGDCGDRFELRADLKQHLKIHTAIPKMSFRCVLCDEPFQTRGERRQHETTMHKTCSTCGKGGFATFSTLVSHVRTLHPEDTCGQEVTCDQCSKEFRNREALRRHVTNVHVEAVPFQCSACGQLFRNKRSLSSHFNSRHSTENVNVCHICDRRLGSPWELRRHIRRLHVKEKRYVCNICGKAFTYPQTLSRHKPTHTSERRFECPLCSKSFSTWENRHVHIFSHFNKKIYECKHCGESFMRASVSKAHAEKVHPDLPAANLIFKNRPFKYIGNGRIDITDLCSFVQKGELLKVDIQESFGEHVLQ